MHKILQVIYPQPNLNIGGSDLYLLELSELINSYSKGKSDILYTRKGGLSKILEEKGNIKSFFFDERKNNFIKAALKLNEILKRVKPHIVHTHGYDSNYLIVVYKILQKIFRWPNYKCVFITTTHGWINEPFKIFLKTIFDYLIIHFFDGVVIVNPAQEKLVKKLSKKGVNIKYIKTGVKIASFKTVKKNKSRNQLINPKFNKNIHIAFIGRLSKEKRVDLAIEVFKEILKITPTFQCSIFGGGDKSKEVIELLKNLNSSMKKRIVFRGYLDKDLLEKELSQNIDILLITSDTEGCPRTALEAMSTKTLVISRPVGYMEKLIGKNERGLLLTSMHPELIAKEIIEFINQSKTKIRRILKNAENYVIRNHSPEKFVNDYLRFYQEVYNITSIKE